MSPPLSKRDLGGDSVVLNPFKVEINVSIAFINVIYEDSMKVHPNVVLRFPSIAF